MPRKPLKTCTESGCPVLVRGGGRCPEHARIADRARGTAAERGYGVAWSRRRRAFLRRFPGCQEPGCFKPATDVHHATPRKQLVAMGVVDPDADQYLESLCHSHHSRRTATEAPFGSA